MRAWRLGIESSGGRRGVVDTAGANLLHPTVGPRKFDLAHQSNGGKGRYDIPVGVDLPPAQTVARGVGMGMVIVVPSFAEGEQRDQEVVGGVVARGPALRTPDVGGGVHQPGA